MKRKYNKKIISALLILVILSISVGYAFLSTTLNISGTTTAKDNTWNIHFDNLSVDTGSVEATEPTLTTGKTVLNYAVTLSNLGDYYSFTVDTVNEGTIDAMVDTVTQSSLTAEQQKYLEYNVSYEDGAAITKYDLLAAGTSETIKLTIKYKDDIDASDLPKEDQVVNVSLEIIYVQADDNAVVVDSTLSKSKFQSFASANKPTSIVFTNTGSSTGTDVSEAGDGSILAWMGTGSDDTSTMYVSRDVSGKYVYAPVDSSYLFTSGTTSGWQRSLTNIDVTYLNTSNVTDTSYMFKSAGYKATDFETVGLDNWDTSSVTNMKQMFYYTGYYANSLSIGNLNNWDTSNVTDMSVMFYCVGYNATNWTIGNLSSWNTGNVTDMYSMFDGAGYSATSFDIGNIGSWDTGNVTYMSYMFNHAGYSATNWTIGDLSNWDTSNVTSMNGMFIEAGYNDTNWTIGDLNNWDTSSATNMYQMFYNAGYSATNWTIGDLSNWDTSNVTDMGLMFYQAGYNATTKTNPNVSGWNVNKVTSHSNFNTNATWITAPTWVN